MAGGHLLPASGKSSFFGIKPMASGIGEGIRTRRDSKLYDRNIAKMDSLLPILMQDYPERDHMFDQ